MIQSMQVIMWFKDIELKNTKDFAMLDAISEEINNIYSKGHRAIGMSSISGFWNGLFLSII
jgi:hypothetical protein